jgi:membrane associated rhomboid family serine protease
MRSAAVGFQCPNCVAEGAKQTRSGRTAYGGELSRNPALTSMVIIGLNAVVWLLAVTSGGSDSSVVRHLSLWREDVTLVPRNGHPYAVPGVADGAYWQLLTNAFVHVEPWHIGFNMLALWFLGPQLELAIGRARFVALYVGSALAGSTMVLWFTPAYTYTLGASGAIFGLMAALLVLALKVRGNTQEILTWIGINFAITVVGRGFISWEGHLGGFIGGLLLMGLIAYAPRDRRTFWQVTGFVVFGLALAVAVLARVSALS